MSEFKQQKWSMEMIPKDILIEKNKRLEQALEEIKEIAETCSFTDNTKLLLNRFEQILQKISEVINGR